MMVTIYGWDEDDFRCVPCLKAKRICEVKGIDYVFIPVAKFNPTIEHHENMKEIQEKLQSLGKELKSFPQVFASSHGDVTHVGGFTDLKEFIHDVESIRWEM